MRNPGKEGIEPILAYLPRTEPRTVQRSHLLLGEGGIGYGGSFSQDKKSVSCGTKLRKCGCAKAAAYRVYHAFAHSG